MQLDPARLTRIQEHYRYASNTPTNATDPTGYDSFFSRDKLAVSRRCLGGATSKPLRAIIHHNMPAGSVDWTFVQRSLLRIKEVFSSVDVRRGRDTANAPMKSGGTQVFSGIYRDHATGQCVFHIDVQQSVATGGSDVGQTFNLSSGHSDIFTENIKAFLRDPEKMIPEAPDWVKPGFRVAKTVEESLLGRAFFSEADRNAISQTVLHEIGHQMGATHINDDTNSVMRRKIHRSWKDLVTRFRKGSRKEIRSFVDPPYQAGDSGIVITTP